LLGSYDTNVFRREVKRRVKEESMLLRRKYLNGGVLLSVV
jgi:hypothetical protein